MINVSSAFKQALINNNRQYEMTVNITLSDNTALTLTNSNIMMSGFSMDDAVSDDNAFHALGGCVINSATLIINNRDDTFSQYDFQNATVVIYLTLVNERIKKGTFRVNNAIYNGFSITLELLDYMENFDRPYSSSSLTYPATLDDIVRDACTHCGVTLHTLNFPHKSFVITTAPSTESTTFRDVLVWATTIAGCFARCNIDGELEIKWFDTDTLETFLEDDERTSNYDIHYLTSLFSQSVAVEDTVITGVEIKVKTDADSQSVINKYTAGQAGYVISIENNELITDANVSEIITWLGTQLIGLRFRQLNITHPNDPTIEAGDIAVVKDRKNNEYPILITRTAFKISNKQTTVCASETPSKNSATRYSESTKTYVESRKLLKNVQTTFEERQEELEEQIENAGGLYKTEVVENNATKIYYHNKPDLADSDIIMLFSDVGFTISADGGTTWYGLTVDGVLIASILNTVGVNADWINTGELVISKTVGTTTQEMLYANVDTGVVRIVADSFSLSNGKTLQSVEDDAKKVANNYLSADNTGIMIADMTDGTIETPTGATSRNVFIEPNAVEIRNGQTSLASFGTESGVTKVRVGESNSGHIDVVSSGLTIYAGATVGSTPVTYEIAKLGYETVTEGSTSYNAPVFTIGSRKSGAGVGGNSVALGTNVEASGSNSYAEGSGVKASGSIAHAEGSGTEATASYSHAEGRTSKATGLYAHAENFNSTASGESSHAGGDTSIASGNSSFAHGLEVKATGTGTLACGKYNVADSGDLFCVGNGTTNNLRKDAFCVTSNGNIIVAGAFYSGNRDGSTTTRKTFTTDSVSVDNQTVGASSNKTFTLNMAKTGYTPFAIRSITVNNATTSGALSSYCNVYAFSISGNNVIINLRNTATGTDAKIKVTAEVAYIADSAL